MSFNFPKNIERENEINRCALNRVVMLESHLVHSGTLTESEGADLYILAGHEASY